MSGKTMRSNASSKPRRPMTAYNIFYREERIELLRKLNTSPQPDFKDLARYVAKRWKAIEPEQKVYYDQLAMTEKQKYASKLVEWYDRQQEERKDNEEPRDTPKNEPSIINLAAPNCFPAAVEDDFSKPVFGMKYYDLEMTAHDVDGTFVDSHDSSKTNIVPPSPGNFYHLGPRSVEHEPVPFTLTLDACSNNNNNNMNQEVSSDNFYNMEPYSMEGQLADDNSMARGSLAWVSKELGTDGARMLVHWFSRNDF